MWMNPLPYLLRVGLTSGYFNIYQNFTEDFEGQKETERRLEFRSQR